MRLDPATCRSLLVTTKVARLATVGPEGPHIVPIVFAADGDVIVSLVDEKPKTTRALQRLANLERDPRAAVLADHYDDADWNRLWWVRADAVAEVTAAPDAIAAALPGLRARYPQYRTEQPAGPLIRMTVRRWVGWAAAPAAIAG